MLRVPASARTSSPARSSACTTSVTTSVMSNMLRMVRLSLPSGAPSLADAVVESIRAGITAGELVPGRTYSVYQLVEGLGAAVHDEDRFWLADQQLHDRLMRAGGNQRAAAIIERLRATTALLGPPTTTAGRTLPEICDEHEPIVTAVLDRRGADAESTMRHHLEHTGRLLARTLQRDPPGEAVSQSAPRRAAAAG